MTLSWHLTDEQVQKLVEWKKTLSPEPRTAIGGAFTYSFTDTSIGTVIKVKYWDGQEIDLTDYDF